MPKPRGIGSGRLPEYRRMRAVHFEQADAFETRFFEPGAGFLRGSAHLGRVVGFVTLCADRRYGDEVFQAFPNFSEY